MTPGPTTPIKFNPESEPASIGVANLYRGYTKRWRKRWDKDYCKDHLLFTMMEYFIDHANYQETKIFFPNIGLIPLKRGEHVFSTVKLSEKLGVDRQRIRTKLKILKNIEFLTIKSTKHDL